MSKVSPLAVPPGLNESRPMWLPIFAITGILLIVGTAVLFVSVSMRRPKHRGIVREVPPVCGGLVTVRDELRRIARETDVPDVMPPGVRRANALDTADQLDSLRADGDSGGAGGIDGDGD